MQPIARELPLLSEGEKHKLAMVIREAAADGRVTPDDLARIREYSSRSARDGDARP
jgi:hypothetical protein